MYKKLGNDDWLMGLVGGDDRWVGLVVDGVCVVGLVGVEEW